MVKPKISNRAVIAALECAKQSCVPNDFEEFDRAQQRSVELGLMRQVLIAAALADLEQQP